MSITKAYVEQMFTAARAAFSGAHVAVRHGAKTYTGTRLPCDKGETVDESGAMYTISGGVRLMTSELGKPWPKPGDTIDVQSGESGAWLTFTVLPTRFGEMEATMLLNYGERYDQPGAL